MGSYQKAPQKGITKLQYLLRGSFVLFLFQLTIIVYPQKFSFLYEVFEIKEYNDFKTDYMYIDKEVKSLC